MKSESQALTFPCIRVSQPIGDFYVGSVKAKDLCEITTYDFRRLVKEVGFASYLGIQRRVDPSRVQEITKYVTTRDACFPTAVILSVPGECATFDNATNRLTLSAHVDEDPKRSIAFDKIATVLDGQHRLAALKEGKYKGDFEINVSVFIDIDIADQAYVFSTVNLAQTKVKKSLVYDLFDLAKKRSPQKNMPQYRCCLGSGVRQSILPEDQEAGNCN